jgi:hypothetical protein
MHRPACLIKLKFPPRNFSASDSFFCLTARSNAAESESFRGRTSHHEEHEEHEGRTRTLGIWKMTSYFSPGRAGFFSKGIKEAEVEIRLPWARAELMLCFFSGSL